MVVPELIIKDYQLIIRKVLKKFTARFSWIQHESFKLRQQGDISPYGTNGYSSTPIVILAIWSWYCLHGRARWQENGEDQKSREWYVFSVTNSTMSNHF